MSDKTMKEPGPDHPITIERSDSRIVVRLNDKVVAQSDEALTLREASYPPVHYIPRADVDMDALVEAEATTHCPYKGDATYWSVLNGGRGTASIAWSYEEPYPSVASIRGHLAFYPDRVDAIEEVQR